MKNVLNKASTTIAIALMIFTSSFQAMADDTEIFFSSVSLSGATSIQPNVLMVLDTSSSMTNIVDENNNGNDDPGERSRLEHMKEAMHTILDNTNNINVGIMRFHERGGPVLFPVADINADVTTVIGAAASEPQAFYRIKNGTDDIEQSSLRSTSSSNDLTIGTKVLGANCGDSGNTSVSVQISNDNDDVEESASSGNMDRGSSDLDAGDRHIGLYFRNINIPMGANIACAYLDFEVQSSRSDDTDVIIKMENNSSPATFGNGKNDLTGRFNGSESTVAWDSIPQASNGSIVTSPDIGSLVQEIVDDANWAPNNNMVVMLEENGGHKDWDSHNSGSGNDAPYLRVEYSTGGAIPYNNKVGLRFTDVRIPQGATITSAYIDFTSVNETFSDPTSAPSTINIYAEDVDNSPAFNTGLLAFPLTSRFSSSKVTASSPLTWAPSTWDANSLYSTPDLKDLVQDIVDRGTWCGGNAMSFKFDAVTGTRKAVSENGNESVAPALRIEYDEATATGCNTLAIQAQIKTGNDDAEEETSSGNVDFGSSDIELNEDGSTSQIVGLRFQDINVSSGDTINSAELEFTVDDDDTDSDTINVTIYGEYAGDSQAFSSVNKISTRTKTTASVNWSPGAWNTSGDKHVSPDISSIVQEIVGHAGWSALNNMSFIIEGTTGERTAESYDDNPISAAKLRIFITGTGSGGSAGVTTVRHKLHDIVDEIAYKSGTPIVSTLYEAGLYYRGGEVFFGRTRGGGYELDPLSEGGSRRELTRVSHEASYTGSAPTRDGSCTSENLTHDDCETERIVGSAVYDSPIEYECQDNHIVFLSDGSPSREYINEVSNPYFGSVSSCAGSGDEKCGEEILSFLNNNDQIDNGTLAEDQKITTHTIGFNFSR